VFPGAVCDNVDGQLRRRGDESGKEQELSMVSG
jgi:hypothetical protein